MSVLCASDLECLVLVSPRQGWMVLAGQSTDNHFHRSCPRHKIHKDIDFPNLGLLESGCPGRLCANFICFHCFSAALGVESITLPMSGKLLMSHTPVPLSSIFETYFHCVADTGLKLVDLGAHPVSAS